MIPKSKRRTGRVKRLNFKNVLETKGHKKSLPVNGKLKVNEDIHYFLAAFESFLLNHLSFLSSPKTVTSLILL